MPPIKIDDTEYSSENLSENSKAYLSNIAFIKSEISKLETQIRIYKVAESNFAKLLKEDLQSD